MRLDYPGKDGVSRRQHLEQVFESTGKIPKDLEEPEIPERFDRVWDLFWEMRNGESITYQELDAYQRLTGESVSPWEVEQIRFMDGIVQAEIARLERKQRGQKDTDNRVQDIRR